MYICCVNESHNQQSLESTERLDWGWMREKLKRLLNVKELIFTIQNSKSSIIYSTSCTHEVFDHRMKTVLEQELSLQHEQGILSVSSSIVVSFGPQSHNQD